MVVCTCNPSDVKMGTETAGVDVRTTTPAPTEDGVQSDGSQRR